MGKTKTKTSNFLFLRIPSIFCALVILATFIFSNFTTKTPNVSADRCITEACRKAAADEKAAMQKAANATTAANTLAGEVSRIDSQIAMYEASIKAQAAIAEDLTVKIRKNQKKLAREQAALAEILVDVHFEGQPEALMILASSNSIGDYAEKQSRIDTVKDQVNRSAQIVKKTKEELEEQKKEVDRAIASQQQQRDAANEERAKREKLVNEYRDKADQYESDAAKAREIRIANTTKDAQRVSGGTIVQGGINTYPYANRCPRENLLFSNGWGYGCQCVSYTGWKAYERWGVSISGWGNANRWAKVARAQGYRVEWQNPAPHTIAVSEPGPYGHVMWVEKVNGDGSIDISEYNYIPGSFSYRKGVSPAGLYFIYFQ